MCLRGLTTVSVVVFASAFALGATSDKDLKIRGSFKVSAKPVKETFYIYPRTGRLFHADYVRDNEIFRSLERTNFMRRGPFSEEAFVKRTKREDTEDILQKKYVYVSSGRVPGEERKKSATLKEKDIISKKSFHKTTKLPVDDTKIEKRTKREVANDKESLHEDKNSIISPKDDTAVNDTNVKKERVKVSLLHIGETPRRLNDSAENEQKTSKEKENVYVEPYSKVQHGPRTSSFRIPHVEDNVQMIKTVVDDSLNLYPVYKGVKHSNPVTKRRLIYTPQMTVELDLPEAVEYFPTLTSNDSTSLPTVEGRSKRPFKKLAFPLLLALKLKTAIMMPMILGLISLIAFKGLWSGLTALGIAAALGLRALVGSAAKVVIQPPPLVHPPPHVYHHPPHEYAEYWSRRDDFNDYRPSSWT